MLAGLQMPWEQKPAEENTETCSMHSKGGKDLEHTRLGYEMEPKEHISPPTANKQAKSRKLG